MKKTKLLITLMFLTSFFSCLHSKDNKKVEKDLSFIEAFRSTFSRGKSYAIYEFKPNITVNSETNRATTSNTELLTEVTKNKDIKKFDKMFFSDNVFFAATDRKYIVKCPNTPEYIIKKTIKGEDACIYFYLNLQCDIVSLSYTFKKEEKMFNFIIKDEGKVAFYKFLLNYLPEDKYLKKVLSTLENEKL